MDKIDFQMYFFEWWHRRVGKHKAIRPNMVIGIMEDQIKEVEVRDVLE